MNNFKGISESSNIIYEINKSKFLSFSFLVFDLITANKIIKEYKTKFSDSNHVCYAFIINCNEKCSDDGEPVGTAGKPMLEVLKKRELKNVLTIVVRYFGGVKLGAGGLSRAYGTATSMVLDKSGTQNYQQFEIIKVNLNLGYEEKMFNNFIIKFKNIKILNKTYSNYLTVDVAVLESDLSDFISLVSELIKRDDFYIHMNKEFLKD